MSKYTRKNKTITKYEEDENGNMKKVESHTFGSINEAKYASRNLQKDEDGALGRGSLKNIS